MGPDKRPRENDGSDSEEEVALRGRLAKVMEGFKAEVLKSLDFQCKEMQDAFTQEIARLRKEFSDYKAATDKEMGRLTAKVSAMADTITGLQGDVQVQEQRDRAANLVMVGVAEGPSTPAADVARLLPQVDACRVMSAERLGKVREGPSARPRPILIKFSSVQEKHCALKSSKDLRAQKVYLDMDLTPLQRENRVKLGDRYRAHKAQGRRPFWRYDTLHYYGPNGQVCQEGSSRRAAPRGRSSSQPTTSPPHFRPSQQPTTQSRIPPRSSDLPPPPSSQPQQ